MIGMSEADTSARYRAFGEQARAQSPTYERLALAVADDGELLRRLDELSYAKRQPNLLFAAARYLDGPVASHDAFHDWALDHWGELTTTMLARRTQTNEPRRCATLLPVLASLPQPLALLEAGASAGLCLYPDRYAYRYCTPDGEHTLGSSPVQLPCEVAGPVPLPSMLPSVAWRAGLDLNPLDVQDDDDVRWLDALIWPEQSDRFAVLRGAVQIARADPPRLVRGDLLRDLPALAAQAPRGATLVVFHTAVLAYVDAGGRTAFTEMMRELGACWISNEAPGVITPPSVDATSFVLARDGVPIALTGSHGQSLTWLS